MTPITDAVRRAQEAFFQRLDKELLAAHGNGLDLAVAEAGWKALPTAGEHPVKALQFYFWPHPPGTPLPLGYRWTVYHWSATDPRASDDK